MITYKRCYLLFLTGSIGYCLLEIMWRGYTHPSMGIAGGICLIGIYYINKLKCYSRFSRAFLCTLLVTLTELLFGVILNKVLQLAVWDYSSLPFNFKGQICLSFSLLWFCLSYTILFVLDYVQRKRD